MTCVLRNKQGRGGNRRQRLQLQFSVIVQFKQANVEASDEGGKE